MSTSPFTARISDELIDELTSRGEGQGLSRAKLAERYIEEGMLMDDHPGIVFRDGPSGRRAAVAGGMDVWEMIAIVKDQPGKGEEAIAEAAEYLEVSPVVVRTAVNFYAANRAGIDSWIERNRAESDEAEAAWNASLESIS